MPKPQYPTKDGIWSKGKRNEESYEKVTLGFPFTKAVSSLRKAMESREDFDPATLFVWGTMQATAVLNILKDIEKTFGEAGQEIVRKAISRTGYEAAAEMLKNSDIPEDLDEIERASYIVTGINTILYASLEKPWIENNDRCEFDILWCPHQDRYTAFDCRVQRYFVEGMIEAMEQLGNSSFTAAVTELIPHGADRCHFVVDRREEKDGKHPWHSYSEELGKRALDKMEKDKA